MDATTDKRFADCCGAGPLELMIERAEDGAVVARGALEQPFALIGRDPYCDIHLNDPVVSLRHAVAQVVNGNLFIVDLASTTGTHWPLGKQSSGWLAPGEPLAIGPFRLFLTRPAATHPTVLVPDFHPLTSIADGPGSLPPVVLEFLTGRTDRTNWEVNRVLTLVGRASDCKLNLSGEEIGLYNAYLIKTVLGLWVVDLLARGGTKVNGKKVRTALLNEGDELTIGKFSIGVKYPKVAATHSPEDSAISFNMSQDGERVHTGTLGIKSSARIGRPEEGTMLAPDGALPSAEDDFATLTPAPLVPVPVHPALPLLKQLADLQDEMYSQFQQTLFVVMQMLSEPGSKPGELMKVTERARTVPLPETLPQSKITEESATHHEAMWQKMAKLNEERQGLWQRLIGKITN